MSKFNPNLGGYFQKPQRPTSGASQPKPVTRTVRTSPQTGYHPSEQGPWGPTGGASGGWATPGTTGGAGAYVPPARQPGLLSTPGQHEQWWDRNKAKFDSPTQGERTMADAGNIFRNKSNAQRLYESGNQGLNTFYQRELDKRQADLENRMAAMGVFGSGATARSMYELQGELGASQARDMADLAAQADSMEQGRASGLQGVGSGMHGAEMGRLGMGGSMSRSVQDTFQDRVRMPLNDARQQARDLSGIFRDFSTKTADEQAAIFNDVVQTIVAESGVEWHEAEQQAREMMQGMGIGIQGFGNMPGQGPPPPPVVGTDPNAVYPGRTYQ